MEWVKHVASNKITSTTPKIDPKHKNTMKRTLKFKPSAQKSSRWHFQEQCQRTSKVQDSHLNPSRPVPFRPTAIQFIRITVAPSLTSTIMPSLVDFPLSRSTLTAFDCDGWFGGADVTVTVMETLSCMRCKEEQKDPSRMCARFLQCSAVQRASHRIAWAEPWPQKASFGLDTAQLKSLDLVSKADYHSLACCRLYHCGTIWWITNTILWAGWRWLKVCMYLVIGIMTSSLPIPFSIVTKRFPSTISIRASPALLRSLF